MIHKMSLLLVTIGLLIPKSAVAGSSSTAKHSVIAWSKDESNVVIRRQWRGFEDHGDWVGDKQLTVIDLYVVSCKDKKAVKHFSITTMQKQSPGHRKRTWEAAEKWLKIRNYVFTVGKKAKKSALTMAPLGKALAKDEKTRIPLPKAFVKRGTAHLEPVVSDTGEHLLLQLIREGKARPTEVGKAEIGGSDLTCHEHAYSPKGKWVVVICTEPGAYASTYSHYYLFSTAKAESMIGK